MMDQPNSPFDNREVSITVEDAEYNTERFFKAPITMSDTGHQSSPRRANPGMVTGKGTRGFRVISKENLIREHADSVSITQGETSVFVPFRTTDESVVSPVASPTLKAAAPQEMKNRSLRSIAL